MTGNDAAVTVQNSVESASGVDLMKYVRQLEKRVEEQEQLIALLNEKLDSSKSSRPVGSKPSAADVVRGHHVSRGNDDRSGVSFVGSRRSVNVSSVVTKKYTQYFVTRVSPDVTAETLAKDLLSNVEDLTAVKCSKMKTKHSSYASFHVTVPAELGHLVESEGAWPEGSLAKNFSGKLLSNYILESFDTDAPEKPLKKGSGKPNLKNTSAASSGGTTASGSVNPKKTQTTGGAALGGGKLPPRKNQTNDKQISSPLNTSAGSSRSSGASGTVRSDDSHSRLLASASPKNLRPKKADNKT